MPGRPRVHPDLNAARSAANRAAAERARAEGRVQRSVTLPAASWTILRDLRRDDEQSYSATLDRLIAEASQAALRGR